MLVAAAVVCAMASLTLVTVSLGAARPDWPPFLRATEHYPVQIAEAVRRLWVDPTFTRTVSGKPAPVPLAFYLRFVDAPDVTAAAARHLRLTTYEVRALGDDWFAVDNGDRTQGVYRVLARDGGRRVMISWGSHRGSIFGELGGGALTVLDFAADGDRATQRLVVNATVAQGFAASVTRPFLKLFGRFVDKKLGEAFQTAAGAAAWAHAKPDEFCAWLGRAFSGERRAQLLGVFAECARA